MSLDVALMGEQTEEECDCPTCGHTHRRNERPTLFSANITHNLGKMASEAGVYHACWRPDEHGMTAARDIIEPLRRGLETLRADPARFRVFDAPNGWGSYANLVDFVATYLTACEEHPDATLWVSR